MMRIKLFGLFIAFALLALVRPRKCLELLEAADRGVAAAADPLVANRLKKLAENKPKEVCRHGTPFRYECEECAEPTCALPPPGWRCTRAAGRDGPCAAVAK